MVNDIQNYKREKLDVIFNLRMTQDDKLKLDILSEELKVNKSDIIRISIKKIYDELTNEKESQ